jgi:hypothetical protein
MKNSIIVLLALMFAGCNSQSDQKSDAVNQLAGLESDSVFVETFKNPLPVTYTDNSKPDTMFLIFNNDSLMITPMGKVFIANKLYFDIKPKIAIRKLYFQPMGDDFIVFYEYSDTEGGGSMVKRISAKQNKIIWETPIYAFNMANPALVGDYAYLSTMGFIGKLNMIDGKYAWKFEELNKKYGSFNEPKFLKDSSVLFTRKIPIIVDSIIVDDRNGKILKMD